MLLTTLPARPVRTSVFRPFDRRFDRAFAQLADLAFGPSAFDVFERRFGPNVSATWNDGSYVVTVDVPGVPQEALSVSVADRTLVLEAKTENLTWSERVQLSRRLDVEATTAQYANGRLTVTVPAKPETQPRTIEIAVGNTQAQLDAGSDQPAGNETPAAE
jgi:HSP20 family molecular chaperone IbpA